MSEELKEGGKGPKKPPWAQMSGESDAAFRAFLIYRDLGPERSIAAVAAGKDEQDEGKRRVAPGHLCGWSAANFWVERARAWDAYCQREKDRATIRAMQRWEARRVAAREERFQLSEKLMRKAIKMLKFLIVTKEITTVTRNGVAVQMTTISPAKWTYRDVLATFQLAAELQDMALGDPLASPEGYAPAPSRAARRGPGDPPDPAGRRALRSLIARGAEIEAGRILTAEASDLGFRPPDLRPLIRAHGNTLA